MIGQRIRIKWLTGANGNGTGGKQAGYWYLRPETIEGKPGWRLTYQIKDQDVKSFEPIEGWDGEQGVMILMANIQDTVIECFRRNQKEIKEWEETPDSPPSFWPQGYRRVRGVKNFSRWQESKMKTKGRAIITNMVKDVERVVQQIADKGWPTPVVEPWPWEGLSGDKMWALK